MLRLYIWKFNPIVFENIICNPKRIKVNSFTIFFDTRFDRLRGIWFFDSLNNIVILLESSNKSPETNLTSFMFLSQLFNTVVDSKSHLFCETKTNLLQFETVKQETSNFTLHDGLFWWRWSVPAMRQNFLLHFDTLLFAFDCSRQIPRIHRCIFRGATKCQYFCNMVDQLYLCFRI